MIKAKNINPLDPAYHDRPLWVVYGGQGYQLLCCKVNNHPTCGLIIWGYSVYKRKPGFRTLGIKLTEWVARERETMFFANQIDALEVLADLTAPKCAA